jgi:hypothetical protein
MDAIYASARERQPVSIPEVDGRDAFRGLEPDA